MIPTVELSKLADLTVGFVGTMAAHYRDEGVPFLRSLNVKPHRISTENLLYVDPAFEGSITKSRLREGDVVIVRTGKPGDSAVIPAELGGANCSDLVIVRPRPRVDPRWLSYSINAATHGFVRGELVGAVQQHFNVKSALRMPIPDFSFAEQRAVGEVLGALDDKIAANQAVADSADELRNELWLSIARGAELTPLSSLATFVNGGAYTKDATGNGRVVVRIAELNSGFSSSTVRNELDVPEKNIVRAGDLLMSWSGSLISHRWFREEAIVNQHIFKVVPAEGRSLWAVECAVNAKLDEFREIAEGKATTMGHIKRSDLDTLVADPKIDGSRDQAGAVLWECALSAERESEKLAATRDELLPLLMSGKIAVKDAEKTVEEVV